MTRESFVYIVTSGHDKYQVRIRDTQKEYLRDAELTQHVGEKVLRVFIVKKKLAGKALKAAEGFVKEYNAGKNPNMEELEGSIDDLIGQR